MNSNEFRTIPSNTDGRKYQSGLSLVELLIGMLLGLVVVSAVFNMYTGSTRSSRFTEGLQSMQENGRYGISVLQQGLRLAGYTTDTPFDPIDISAGDAATVVIQLQQSFDCNGQDTAPVGGIAINTYRLDAANQLITCEGNSAGATVMPIIEGVDGFRVLYGIDADDDDVPEQYIPYDATIESGDVSSLRFALLVNSGQPIRSKKVSETYVLLDTEVTTDDRFARNVFGSTIKFRNRR